MDTFTQLPLLPTVQEAITQLGFTKPTEIQAKIIPVLIENPKQDIHAQAQTGTGKTLAFGIPLLQTVDPSHKKVQALVVAPTRELVLQIYESIKEIARNTGIVLEPVYGGMPIERQIANIKRGAQIIIGTPGRLNDHLRRKTLNLEQTKILVLDEADIMLDMGFKEEVDDILKHLPTNRAIWLFSATVMPGIKQLVKSHMHNATSVRASAESVITAQVTQYYCVVPYRKRVAVAARFIEASPDFYGIIFCQTKLLTSEVTEQLASKGFKVNCLHGDMKQTLRNRVIKGFKDKDFNILVATNVAARGLDVSNLTHVINFSLPEEHESYIHRIGRTGRAGKQGIAIVFVAPDQLYAVRRLEKIAKTTLLEIPVPPLESIINAKMGAISDFIEQAKQPDRKLSLVHKTLRELINSFSEEEIRNSFALALEEKFFKDISHEKLDIMAQPAAQGPQEICMELGRNAGFTEKNIRDYIYNTCNLLPQEVTKVRVLDNRTFISVPENRLHDCLATMRNSPINAHKPRLFLVEDIRKDFKKPGNFEKRRRSMRRSR